MKLNFKKGKVKIKVRNRLLIIFLFFSFYNQGVSTVQLETLDITIFNKVIINSTWN